MFLVILAIQKSLLLVDIETGICYHVTLIIVTVLLFFLSTFIYTFKLYYCFGSIKAFTMFHGMSS